MTDLIYSLPQQLKDARREIRCDLSYANSEKADAGFKLAAARLLDVNNWNKICRELSATFSLADDQGNRVESSAKINLYIKIDMPGHEHGSVNEFNWARIEKIQTYLDEPHNREEFYIQVRPAKNPAAHFIEIAHFFSDTGTITFLLQREHAKVSASIISKNEAAGLRSSNLFDKVRSFFIGSSASLGFSGTQWKRLAKKLLAN